jgi:hypothetical protein
MRNFYISAWVLLAVAAFAAVLTNSFNPLALLIFSLIALVLVFTLMLWTVIVNTRELETPIR